MGYADYVKNTAGSSGGQMLVRVADSAGQGGVINGNDIQFFVRSGLSSTFVGSPGFGTSVFANGGWIGLSNVANYSGSTDWRHVGTINIGTNQTITFHINASGTSGFGGADDFAVAISRAVVPQAPTAIGADNIMHQQFRYRFSGNWDGGSPIREWQIGYGYYGNGIQWTAPSNGTIDVGTFVPGSLITIWSRGRNDVGWGPWSDPQTVVQLLRGIKVKQGTTWKDAIPYVKLAGVWRPCEIYVKQAGVWKIVGL